MRTCTTCQHFKRPEIDRRLAGGEPLTYIASDYGLNPSSLYRHRKNCLHLGSSNAIKKEAARGSAAAALLPSAGTLSGEYAELRNRIDQIAAQAQEKGSLRIALAGLASIRQILDSQARLAAHEAATGAAGHGAAQADANGSAKQIAERLIEQFDQEPELKARIAAALLQMDDKGGGASLTDNKDGASAAKTCSATTNDDSGAANNRCNRAAAAPQTMRGGGP